jgi:hypothetical protein
MTRFVIPGGGSARTRILPRAVLAALFFLVVPAAADAPVGQYERFDSDTITIKDTKTLLEWDRRNIVRDSPQDLARLNCSTRTANPKYRLPTVKELLTIVDEQPHDEYEFGAEVSKMIDQPAFDGTPIDLPYWSSTPAGPGKFWTVSFKTGLMEARGSTASDKGNARCVR